MKGHLRCSVVVEAAVAAQSDGLAPHAAAIKGSERVAERLDKVVEVIWLLEERFGLLAQAACAGLRVRICGSGQLLYGE